MAAGRQQAPTVGQFIAAQPPDAGPGVGRVGGVGADAGEDTGRAADAYALVAGVEAGELLQLTQVVERGPEGTLPFERLVERPVEVVDVVDGSDVVGGVAVRHAMSFRRGS
ncbi:hypothetical protein ACRJ4B_13700 [Streptomyces sp. GTA36]